MSQMKKTAALLLAGILYTAGICPKLPELHQSAAETASVRTFAESVLPTLRPTDEHTFLNLHYSAEEAQLYLDGAPAGTEAAGFRIENGTLLLDAAAVGAAGGMLTPEEAEHLIGCEVHISDSGIDVISPFQRAELLVKSNSVPNTYGAEAVSADYDGLRVLQYSSPAEAYRAYQAFAADDTVLFAEPNRVVHIAELPESDASAAGAEVENWGYQAIGADSFQADYLQDSETAVKVAVIDTGIYPAHNWFAGRIAAGGTSFCAEDGGQYTDGHSHGTHCAGIICRNTAPNVRILPLKALDSTGYGTTLALYCAVMYALEQHADVISMSLTGYGCSPLMEEAAAALAAADLPCVVAAGNDADDVKYYEPANIAPMITVASVGTETSADGTPAYTQSYFSNYGDFVDFCAPGERIESAGILSPDATAFKSGTSMATPMVAACCANLLQYDSTMPVAEIYESLRVNALDLGEAGFDTAYGWGMVNLRDFVFAEGGCAAPEAAPAGGDYAEVLSVTLSCADTDAQIYYTTDGSIPTETDALRYEGGEILIAKTTDLRAIAVSENGTSRMLHTQYRIGCAAPEASLPAGEYDAPVGVTLSVPNGAEVYYTTNSDLPTVQNGQRYTGETLEFTETTVLRAAAFLGETESPVLTAVYLIGEAGYDHLFRIENGCLTAYFGALTKVDLPVLLPNTEITEIGADVFAGQTTLTRIVLPDSVTEIGARAFAGCTALSEVTCPWEQLQCIGDAAFAGSAVSGELSLDALKSLGTYAFAETEHLRAVSFGSQITALPEGAFCGSRLQRLSAAGVTEVGAYALYSEETSALVQLELPFAALRAVGEHAFSHVSFTEAGVPDPEFAALETVGAYAFADAACNTMTFSALKTVTPYALDACAAAMLYLPAAETVAAYAISFAEDGKTGVAVGEALRSVAPDGIRNPAAAAVYAGPADSPLHTFAAKHAGFYLNAPAVYVPETALALTQYESRTIRAYPIGTQTELQWDTTDGTALSADRRYGMIPPSEVTGTSTYNVYAVQNGVPVGDAKTITVQVSAADCTGTLSATDTPTMVQWNSAADTSAMYQFTAARAGAYYLFAEDAETDVSIRLRNGQMLTQRGSGAEPERLQSVRLDAGETVQILLKQVQAGVPVFLTATETAPQYTICGASFTPEQQFFARADGIDLQHAALLWTSPATGKAVSLTAGADYALITAQSLGGDAAAAYACGTGIYSGVCAAELVLYEELSADQTLIPEHLTAETRYYRFQPEVSGTYTILTDFTEAMLEAPAQYDICRCQTFLTLYSDKLREIMNSTQDVETQMGQITRTLQAGRTYYIGVSSASGTISAVQLRAVFGNESGNLLLADISVPEAVDYPFAPVEPDCEVYDADGKRLTEGTDYTAVYLNNRLSGRMTVLLHGIGSYYGTSAAEVTILPVPAQTAPDAVLTLDTPTALPAGAGLYHLNIEQAAEVSLRLGTDASWAAAVYRRQGASGELAEYLSPAGESDFPVYLEAGAYALLIDCDAPCSLILETVRVYKDLADARVQMQPLYYTGSPLTPELTVTMNGAILEAGLDYTVALYEPVMELGQYCLEIIGCGDYAGSRAVPFSVRPDPEQDYPLAADGENLVQITAAGTAQIFRWVPQKAHCCIVKTDVLCESVAVFDENGYPVAALGGMDYQYAECSVRIGKTYYIAAGYDAEIYTGAFKFTLLSDYTLLEDCVPEAPDMVPFVPDDSVPAYSLTDGGYQLRAGTDYLVRACGDETVAGRAEIILQGIGRYVGMLCYTYYQYPSLASVQRVLTETVLTLDQPEQGLTGHPAEMCLYRFSADRAGKYYLHLPTSDVHAVGTVIYDSDGNVLPMDTRMLHMEAGESVYLLCITGWLDVEFDIGEEYPIMVSAAPPDVIYTENGYTYMLTDGCAVLSGIPEDVTGLHLPETVFDPVNEISCAFTEIAPDCLEQIRTQCTVYGAAGGAVEVYCTEQSLCFAAEDAVCTVRGDVTGDGVCSTSDVLTLLRWLAECRGMALSSSAWECADFNEDGTVTALDAILMLAQIAAA